MILINLKTHRDLISRLEDAQQNETKSEVRIVLPEGKDELIIYPASMRKSKKGGIFAAGSFNHSNALLLLGKSGLKTFKNYDGFILHEHKGYQIIKCRTSRAVLNQLRKDFPFCAPVGQLPDEKTIAIRNAVGLAGKAHLQAFSGTAGLIMTRQCMHQLKEMELTPEDSIDAATWTVFQGGYEKGFSAEACNVWSVSDLRAMIQAGYTRYTIGPDEEHIGHLRNASKQELIDKIVELPWVDLRDKFEVVFTRYRGKILDLGPIEAAGLKTGMESEKTDGMDLIPESLKITPNEGEILSAIAMFSEAILHIVELEKIIFSEGKRDEVTLEISFARCSEVLTPFEHYFIINELLRRDVQPDYIDPGSLSPEHMLLAKKSSRYGLSGSFDSKSKWLQFVDEKLLPEVPLHAYIADISYITALHCIVSHNKELFRKIWKTSRNRFENVREKSKTSLKIDHIETIMDYPDEQLPKLLDKPYAEEFLTITMPEIMTIRDKKGNRYLRRKIYNFLNNHEDEYTDALVSRYENDS